MEFDAQDLMYLFDAVAHYSIRPEFDGHPNMDAWSEKVAAKIEHKLAQMGYTFDCVRTYTVK